MTGLIESLVRANLLEVFAERNPSKRRAAIEATYSENVVMFDAEGTIVGWDAVDAKAQGLLDGAPEFVFTMGGPALVNHDAGHLAWSFGPAGAEPAVRGFDSTFIENARIVKIYTFLLP